MPGGELADDEEPEPVAVRQVELRRVGQTPVDLVVLLEARPRPRSSTSTASPLATTSARTSTLVCGGEKIVAFSSSSAIRCTTSATVAPAMAISGIGAIVMRV